MKLLDNTDDFELCNQVFCVLSENPINVNTCSELERVVRLIWDSFGLIGNGGFHRLFEGEYPGDCGFIYTVAAYKRIGAQNAYEALQDAMRQFPSGTLPDDIDARLREYEALPEEKWDEIAHRFFEAKNEVVASLALFIREHRVEYKRLLEQKRTEPDAASSN